MSIPSTRPIQVYLCKLLMWGLPTPGKTLIEQTFAEVTQGAECDLAIIFTELKIC